MMIGQSIDSNDIQKIVRRYSLVHRLFFGLGVALCVTTLSIVIGFMLFTNALQRSSLVRNDSSLQQEEMLLSSMRSILDEYAHYEGVNVLIKQGYLSLTGESIVTVDNLLTYNDLIISRFGNLSLANPLPSLYMFSGDNYRGDDLLNYIQNTVMTYPDTHNLTGTNIQLLSFGSSLIDYFAISCISTPKVTDHFCQQAILAMVDVLPVYDLSQDLPGLAKIATVLSKTDSHKKFCDAMKRYLFFSRESSENMRDIMYDCGEEYERSYNDFASFRSVQEQLDKQSINATISPNPLINAYKLISTQQSIYYEMSNRRINDVRIRAYLKYNEELLRRPESLQKIYFDVIARFNNQYLIPSLTRLYFQQKGQEGAVIKGLLENIRMINDGNTILAYPGLSQFVLDKTLILPRSQTLIESGVILRPLLDIFQESYSFPYFLITTKNLGENDTLTVEGSRLFEKSVGLAPKINSSLSLSYDGFRFRVTHATFVGFPRLDDAINTILKDTTMTIAELHDLLVRNGSHFNLPDVGLCDIIKSMSGYVSCNAEKIIFSGYPLSGSTKVTYTITHRDGLLVSYLVDNADINKIVHDQIGVPETTIFTMMNFIQSMLSYRQNVLGADSNSLLSGTADVLQVRQAFTNLGAKIEKISLQGTGVYNINFFIKTIHCMARYDIANQKIVALEVLNGENHYPIRGFLLSLSDLKSSQVQGFITDPRTFLIQIDPLTVKKSGI